MRSHGRKPRRLVECAGSEIDRDRADYADGVKAGQRFELFHDCQNQKGNGDRNDQRNLGHAMFIQARELLRHLAVLRHHVNDPD